MHSEPVRPMSCTYVTGANSKIATNELSGLENFGQYPLLICSNLTLSRIAGIHFVG